MRTASSAAAAANHEYRSARVMMRSRLKCLRRCFGSKSLICAAIRIFRSSSGKPPSGLTPDFPVFNPPQNSSTFVPIGVTTPRPVTTTRRPGLLFDISNDLSCLVRARQTFDGRRRSLQLFLDESDAPAQALAADACLAAISDFTRSTTEPTVLKASTSSLAL